MEKQSQESLEYSSEAPTLESKQPSHRLSAQLSQLDAMDLVALRRHWAQVFGKTPPGGRCADLLRYGIAWKLQAAETSGLSAAASERLSRLTEALRRNPDFKLNREFKPGTLLIREWRGVRHEVRVAEQGFEYAGSSYRSLSEIARAITGTRWNGRAFFGLKKPLAGPTDPTMSAKC